MGVDNTFHQAISQRVWEMKYRLPGEGGIVQSWQRVALAAASVETSNLALVEARFKALLSGFRFLPGGRILAGAGSEHKVTLFNCFVMGRIPDSMEGIFEALKEGALTMQQGGGVGYDFSSLRPAGMPAQSVGGIASGPVSFMRIWDAMCATVLSTGARRGAMMGCLRCDHPDIAAFIAAKRDARELRHFNLSVLVTDEFMKAVETDAEWLLVYPDGELDDASTGPVVQRHWPGRPGLQACRVLDRVNARSLWQDILRATYEVAEPGVLFIDRINRDNNLGYCEEVAATNPCGEIPLPAYGACNLGSLNLCAFVQFPFSSEARVNLPALAAAAAEAVHFLDNVVSLSRFPLPAQAKQAQATRRLGLGLTGLADTLILLGLHYGSDAARRTAAELMATVAHAAYRASIALARTQEAFPRFERERYLATPFVRALPEDIRQGIAEHGIRNSHLIAIAPTGTISLLANNVSSGIEPVFAYRYERRILGVDGHYQSYPVEAYSHALWRARHGEACLPEAFVRAEELPPLAHLQMQAALQPHVDNAISKTVQVAADLDFADFEQVYAEAYRQGLKGCTTYRANPVTGAVLLPPEAAESSHCCTLEREAD